MSGALKTVAVSLVKIANDLRWMNSGPRAGLAEIRLPDLQPGSSIMPGKVNPVIPEVAVQVAGQVIGNDAAITFAASTGNFELNVALPLIATQPARVDRAARDDRERATSTSASTASRPMPSDARRSSSDRHHLDGAEPDHRLREGRRAREGSPQDGQDDPRGRPRARACCPKTSSTRHSTSSG